MLRGVVRVTSVGIWQLPPLCRSWVYIVLIVYIMTMFAGLGIVNIAADLLTLVLVPSLLSSLLLLFIVIIVVLPHRLSCYLLLLLLLRHLLTLVLITKGEP